MSLLFFLKSNVFLQGPAFFVGKLVFYKDSAGFENNKFVYTESTGEGGLEGTGPFISCLKGLLGAF